MELKTDLCAKRELFFLKSTFLNKRQFQIKGKLHLEVKEQEQMSFSCVFYWFINTQSGYLISAE